jgi:hypothetical protein
MLRLTVMADDYEAAQLDKVRVQKMHECHIATSNFIRLIWFGPYARRVGRHRYPDSQTMPWGYIYN